MSNNLDTLNTHLFNALNSLNEDIDEKEQKKRIEKAKAVTSIARQITDNAKVQLEAQKLYSSSGLSGIDKPAVFAIEHKDA